MKKQQFNELETYMLTCMDDNVHDKLHIYRVLNYALQIASAYNTCNIDVVLVSALLHDIGRVEELNDPALCHAKIGAEKSYTFLKEHGYDDLFCNLVKNCIIKHRHSTDVIRETLEEKILFDADKLDLIGTVGVARAILFGGQIDEPLYLLDQNNLPTLGLSGEGPSLFREYQRKLKSLTDTLYTDAAKQIAQKQQNTMNQYFEQLICEVQDNHKNGNHLLNTYLI